MKGGYSEYITVTEDFATKVPDGMKSEYAAPLFCAGITAYKDSKRLAEPKIIKNRNIWNWRSRSHGSSICQK